MNTISPRPELSAYHRSVLNKIIPEFNISEEFSFYKLVEKAVSCKCILASRNALVMETFYLLKEHLLAEGMIIEKREMTNYTLTETGRQLAHCRTIEAFEKWKRSKGIKAMVQRLLSGAGDIPLFSVKKNL